MTRSPLGLLKDTVLEFDKDGGTRLAAALAYYTVFSLPPLLILIISLVGLVVDAQTIERTIISQAGELVGPEGARQIRTMIQRTERPEVAGALTNVLGLLALLFGATGAFVNLQAALNAAWGVQPKVGGLRGFFLKRLFSFGMVLALGFLLLVSLTLTTLVTAFGDALANALPEWFGRYTALAIPLLLDVTVITFLFAAIFKVVPDAEVSWRSAAAGAVFTAVLFITGKFALGFYLGGSDRGSAYGAAGSLALVLLWVYYSAIILFLGAEFTESWARRGGKAIQPSPGAVRVGPGRPEEGEGQATSRGA